MGDWGAPPGALGIPSGASLRDGKSPFPLILQPPNPLVVKYPIYMRAYILGLDLLLGGLGVFGSREKG